MKKSLVVLVLCAASTFCFAQIEKETGMYKTHVNRTFRELKERNLINCKNPKDRYYQTYRITKHGKEVLKKEIRLESIRFV